MNGLMKKRQAGLSLVELMIAMTLGLFLLGGLITILVANRDTYRIQNNLSRINEDMRFAMYILSRDLRASGFAGCVSLADVTNNLDPSGTGFSDWDFVTDGGIQGTDGGGGTDSLTLRGAFDSQSLHVVSPFGPLASANIKVESPNDLSVGDIVLISDCESADIFQITSGSPSINGTVVHNTGSTQEPGNYNPGSCTGANAHCLSKVYEEDAKLYRLAFVNYAVGTGSNGRDALIRRVNGTDTEVVANVVDFQLLYGEDADGDGSPETYQDASAFTMADVVSIRLSLTVESEDDNTASAGGRLQRSMTSTIALRNRS